MGHTRKPNEIKVFITRKESTCDECGEDMGSRPWITLHGERGAFCLSCSELDHLVFLPSGDAALTRRSRKHSTLSAVVLKWSCARKRYERQGLLVEEDALSKAEKECLADEEARARRKERESQRRARLDGQYVEQFAQKVREIFPECPKGREIIIAEHACLKYSDRVGRSAAAKEFDKDAICLAVKAHIRHAETNYDELLSKGYERWLARAEIEKDVSAVLGKWAAQA